MNTQNTQYKQDNNTPSTISSNSQINQNSSYQIGSINTVSPFGSTNQSNTPTPSLMQLSTIDNLKQEAKYLLVDELQQNNNLYQSESQIKLLDQKALNELLNVNVYQLAQNKGTQSPGKNGRKNSDEDVYVEETLQFLYDPQHYQQFLASSKNNSPQNSNHNSSSPSRRSNELKSQQHTAVVDKLLQQVDSLRKTFLVEVHQWNDDIDHDNEEKLFKSIMDGAYADQEIDKLLETFSAIGKLNGNNLINGEYIENDIRLSETIRDTIDEIKQMQRPAGNKSGIIERRRFLQRYIEIAELLDVVLTVEHLLPCLYEIFKQDDGASDKEYVKIIFLHMNKLIDFLGASEITVGYNGIRDHIMQFFNDFFQSDKIDEALKQDIQGDVIDLLVKVSKIMTHEDRSEKILPIILECIRDDSDEEKRILGLELVDKLAEQMGKDNCQNFLMYEIVSLQDDPIYRVRKETISRMINISKVLGKEIFIGILFPVFKKLANDQVWGVRRSAVEQLPNIATLCPIEIKNGVLIDMFKKFAQDQSKWVKMAAFQYLGPFIATYEGIEPNPVLVDYYISMCEQNKSMQADNEVPYHCAYNFPAVLITLGPKSWPKLHQVYESLVKDSRPKVRRTLAFSLHEVAKILGSEIAERELIPVLYHFLKDQEDVRDGVVQNLPKFIQVLEPEQRETYIERLAQTDIDSKDWRKRIVQSQQVRKFSKIFSAETVFKYYVPTFFELCQDQVAEVRKEAAFSIKNIALKLKEQPHHELLFNEFISKVIMFKQSPKYNLRQTFISMCEAIMHTKTQQIFTTYLMSHLCELQRDRIINVRMCLSEALFKHFSTNSNGGVVQSEKSMRLMVKHLKLDSSYVSELLADVDIIYQDDDQQEVVIVQSPVKQQQQERDAVEKQQQQAVVEDFKIDHNGSNDVIANDEDQINSMKVKDDNKNDAVNDGVEEEKVDIKADIKTDEDPYNENGNIQDDKQVEEQKSQQQVINKDDITQKNNINQNPDEEEVKDNQQEVVQIKADDQNLNDDQQLVKEFLDELIVRVVADLQQPFEEQKQSIGTVVVVEDDA